MWRKTVGIVGGIIITIVSAGILTPLIPQIYVQFVPLLIGSTFAGYMGENKGWACGLIVAIFEVIFTTIILILIGSGVKASFPLSDMLVEYFLSILLGVFGGCIGQLLVDLKKQKVYRREQKSGF